MSKWITDRMPTKADAIEGRVWFWSEISNKPSLRDFSLFRKGDPWMPLIAPEAYVKPKRFAVVATNDSETSFNVQDRKRISNVSYFIPTREAAERIAAIYNEVLS